MSARIPLPENLHELYEYDPGTGDLWCRSRIGGGRRRRSAILPYAAKPNVKLADGRQTTAARIIWFLMTGREADPYVRPLNGDHYDLRWENLTEGGRNLARQPVKSSHTRIGLRRGETTLWEASARSLASA
jgi:hypothetical protein